MISPAYVETDDFRVVSDQTIGCMGDRLRLREYRLAANPDQRPADNMSYSIVAVWAENGKPSDAVLHLGGFYRVTVQ